MVLIFNFFFFLVDLQTALNWLCVYILQETAGRIEVLKKEGISQFDIRNNSQTFFARTLAIVYGERMIFDIFHKKVSSMSSSPEKIVLTRLLSLYGANLITKHMGLFYEGEFFTGRESKLYQEGIINLLPLLKDESISLIDAVAPPDFIVNSPLGMSDGHIYKHLHSAIMQSPDVFERPAWWKDVVFRDYVKAKL